MYALIGSDSQLGIQHQSRGSDLRNSAVVVLSLKRQRPPRRFIMWELKAG